MTQQQVDAFHYAHAGRCQICNQAVTFVADGPYYRNSLKCPICQTGPRNRALHNALDVFRPDWRDGRIHESSPGGDALSRKLHRECPRYTAS